MRIIDEIAKGCEEAGAKEIQSAKFNMHSFDGHIYCKIPDRKEAIDFIITKLAKKDDIVVLCGKGHETSMSYKGVERPWSEHVAVKDALKSN